MFAVIKIAAKQYIAEVGKKIKIDAKIKLKDKKVKIPDVLLLADEKDIKIGKPNINNASVEAEIVSEGKDKKISIVKHHPKKRYRRVKGHRQDQTVLMIKKINEK